MVALGETLDGAVKLGVNILVSKRLLHQVRCGFAENRLVFVAAQAFEQFAVLALAAAHQRREDGELVPGVLPQDPQAAWPMVNGRLYGPAYYPQALSSLRGTVRLGLPVIAGVGVQSEEQAEAMLASGALAVQLDTILWK